MLDWIWIFLRNCEIRVRILQQKGNLSLNELYIPVFAVLGVGVPQTVTVNKGAEFLYRGRGGIGGVESSVLKIPHSFSNSVICDKQCFLG